MNKLTRLKIIIITILFLIVVQILFSIPAPATWLVAAWKAGDLLTFIGTITLGFVAYKQTEQANHISRDFINLQEEEYTPSFIATGLSGISKFTVQAITDQIGNDIAVAQMRTIDNELFFGYSVFIMDDDFQKDQETFCRTYQITLRYFSKLILSAISISSITFILGDEKHRFDVNKSIDISLENGQVFSLILNLVTNEDCIKADTVANFCVSAPKLEFAFKFSTVAGNMNNGTLTIQKSLVVNGDSNLSKNYEERFVSSSYKKDGGQK